MEIIENNDQFPGTEVGVEDRFTIGSDNGCDLPGEEFEQIYRFWELPTCPCDIECQKYTLMILLECISCFEISTLTRDGGVNFEN